jgi:hypothetical protein
LPKLGRVWGWLAVAVLGTTELGCKKLNDLGSYCILVRRDPADTNPSDGISSIPVRQGELPQTTGPTSSQRDYISFGSTECEDLVCVRDSSFSEANESGLPVGPNFPAYGTCSSACSPSAQAGCQSADPAIDKDPRTHLSCRQLVLDDATLAHLRETDPVLYQQYFGTNTSPYFCARGTEPTP